MRRFTRSSVAVIAVGFALTLSRGPAADPEDWKVIAKVTSVGDKPAIPLTFGKNKDGPEHGLVFRGPADLASRYVTDPKKASDPAQQAAAAEWAAKLLKVDKIEWTGQMLLAISAGTNTAPHEVRLVSLRVNQGVLTVTWDLDPKTGTGLSDPRALVLVPRFDGEVRFARAEKK